MITNRINYSSESDDTNAGGAERFFLLFMQLQQPAGKGDRMAKFLNYEDRLDIESGLKEHMTFTELGEKLGRDRTTITKEIRNYSIEQDTGYGGYPHNTCKYRKACRRKKCVEQMIAGIRW